MIPSRVAKRLDAKLKGVILISLKGVGNEAEGLGASLRLSGSICWISDVVSATEGGGAAAEERGKAAGFGARLQGCAFCREKKKMF